MTVEFDQNSDTLRLKHPDTGKWTDAITLLRIAEGFDIKLVDAQNQTLESIGAQALNLQQLLASSQGLEKGLQQCNTALSQLSQQSTSDALTAIATEITKIQGSIDALATVVQSNDVIFQSSLSQLPLILDAIGKLSAAINQSQSTAASSQDTVISLSPNTVKSYPLPGITNALEFRGRKNNLGKSYDIYYSFTSGNLEQGAYQTLWAYGEYTKDNLALSNRNLYLACSTAIQVELTAYYNSPSSS